MRVEPQLQFSHSREGRPLRNYRHSRKNGNPGVGRLVRAATNLPTYAYIESFKSKRIEVMQRSPKAGIKGRGEAYEWQNQLAAILIPCPFSLVVSSVLSSPTRHSHEACPREDGERESRGGGLVALHQNHLGAVLMPNPYYYAMLRQFTVI